MATWAKGVDFKNSANTARVGGVGIYGTDGSAQKAYLGIGTEPWNKTGLEVTSSEVSFKGNKVYHAGSKPTPAEIGAAASNHTHNYAATSHNHGLLHDSFGVTIADTTTDNGWSMINSSYNGFLLKSLRSSSNAPAWLQGNYSAGIAFGGADTKGVMSVAYSSPSIRFAGGNGSKPVWYFTVNGSSGKTYNMDSLAANTANTLATARTINGTSFNGSANITTANWGTARTITIGSTAKSVNGSANVAWTLDEIGAAAASHTHSNYASTSHTHSSLTGTTSSTIAPSTGTGVVRYDYNVNSANAGTLPCSNNANGILTMNTHSGNYYSQLGFSSNGNLYYRAFNGAALDTTTAWKQVAFTNSSITGNASTATKLQTARTINGTSFDGSGNITTANWGTARNIYVADADGTNTGAAVSINGSGNATLKLPSTIKASLSGNASTASSLASARLIGKASFNGSANIALDAIAGRATIPSSADTHKNKYSKFARIDVSGGTYRCCSGTLHFVPSEGNTFFGELRYYFRTGSAISSISIDLRWKNLSNTSYANRVFAVKVSDGVYDLYYQPLVDWDTMTVTNVNSVGASYITLTSNQAYVTSITAAVTSSLFSHVSNATAANTANTLATARTINGTSFNGSGNITTANWGTARNIQIGNTAKSVNGSANVTWSLSEIGAAPASHTHNYVPTSAGGNITVHADSDSSTTTEYLALKAGHNILQITSSGGGSTATQGQDKLTFNGNIVYHAGRKPTVSEIGAAAASHTHNYAGSSSAGGNANAAVKLATARTINGTSFDGTANITTANWGTARNIQIGNAVKSVNGSGNVTWNWSEMQVPRAYSSSYSFGGNQNAITTAQFITMLTNLGAFSQVYWVSRGSWSYASNQYINDTGCGNIHLAGCVVEVIGNTSAYTIRVTTPTTTANGTVNAEFIYVNNGKDYSPGWRRQYNTKNKPTASEIGAAAASHTHNYAASPSAGGSASTVYLPRTTGASVSANYLPGANKFEFKEFGNDCKNTPNANWYHIFTGQGGDENYNTQLALGMTTQAVYFRNRTAGTWGGWKQLAFTDSSISGNASTATKLQTARTINGTSFDGTGNITTANWGTARNIQIGNTAKSVNGSANVTWTLGEIGAAASNHTHGLVNLNSEAFSGGNDLNTYNSTKTWVARTLNSTTNKPADYFTVVNFGANSNSNFQLAHSYANNSILYVRGRHDTSGNYTPWAKIYTDKNKPTASEIGAAAASHTHNYAGSSSAGGAANTAVKLATARTIALGGILSGSASFDGSGNVTINAAANDITTITKSLNVTTSWADTGITGSNLGTGTYAVQMYVNDGTNTAQYQEYYSGIMSWYNGGTNSTDADEILLHKAGHASNGRHVYLRTIRTPNSGYLKLQISCTHAFSAASSITFKFKKLI